MWASLDRGEEKVESALSFLAELAKKFHINLVGGSFHRWESETNVHCNICYIFNREGDVIGSYRKRKPFDREIKYGVAAGDAPGIFDIEGFQVGILICADLWYPELCRELIDSVDILCVPAESVVRERKYRDYGRGLWHALALTRSQENSIMTVVADHSVSDNTPFTSGGASITDPSRSIDTPGLELIHQTVPEGAPGYLTAEYDRRRMRLFRRYRRQRGLLPHAIKQDEFYG